MECLAVSYILKVIMHYYNAGIRAIFFTILFFLCLCGLPAEPSEAQDSNAPIQITEKELGFGAKGEYNRTFSYGGDFLLFGKIELNNQYTFKVGFALGSIDKETEIKTFTSGQIALLSQAPLYCSFAYMYYGLPGPSYNLHTHSLLPGIALNGRWAGLSLGTNFRFSSFFGEPAVFEPALAFLGYVNFFNNDKLRVGLSCANFSDFYIGNMGSYSFKLSSDIYVTGHWTIAFEIELLQSGGDGLATTFYGIAYRGGLRYAW